MRSKPNILACGQKINYNLGIITKELTRRSLQGRISGTTHQFSLKDLPLNGHEIEYVNHHLIPDE